MIYSIKIVFVTYSGSLESATETFINSEFYDEDKKFAVDYYNDGSNTYIFYTLNSLLNLK